MMDQISLYYFELFPKKKPEKNTKNTNDTFFWPSWFGRSFFGLVGRKFSLEMKSWITYAKEAFIYFFWGRSHVMKVSNKCDLFRCWFTLLSLWLDADKFHSCHVVLLVVKCLLFMIWNYYKLVKYIITSDVENGSVKLKVKTFFYVKKLFKFKICDEIWNLFTLVI